MSPRARGRRGLLAGLALLAGALALILVGPDPAGLRAALASLAGDEALTGLARWRVAGALAAATLVSEDLTCLASGALVARGTLGLAPAVAACFLGILVGDVLLFLCGRWLGARALERAPFVWFLDEARVAEARSWLERRGGIVILSSRFLPGARLPTYFASGALGTSPVRFTLWFALAGLLWTPLVVATAAGLGGELARFDSVGGNALAWLLGTLAAGWFLLVLARSLCTWRGRALWRARVRRLTRFEYWPIGALYLPVFALVLARTLRGQGLVFTAANPALPHGGFVGESKRAIYRQLAAAQAPLPPHLELAAGEAPDVRALAVSEFRRARGLAFPLVVKPDAGQRGEGVRIVRDEAALALALAEREALVVQAHVAGEEFGLFYARRPGAPGELLSITKKVLPEVVGDGRSTLERLILADPEHLPMARFFLAGHREALARVPAAGERVRLGELGTHCRGARFLDGRQHASAALQAELERIAAGLPGFCFGRFDVRAPSDAALERGEFLILELNGVTSEAAHIYDPRHGWLDAWRSLLGQWRLAYAIGAENARLGARVSTWSELWTAVRDYRGLAARRGAASARAAGAAPVLAEVRS